MGLNVDTALARVDQVAIELGIATPTPSQIALIEMLITAYSEAVAKYLGRKLGYKAEIIERRRGFGNTPRFSLDRFPIYNIISVSTDDGATFTPWSEISDGAYLEDDGQSGIVYAPCLSAFTGGSTPWINKYPAHGTEKACIIFKYEAGYDLPNMQDLPGYIEDLPALITFAVIKGVAAEFQASASAVGTSRVGIKQESLMSHSVTFTEGSEYVADFGKYDPGIGLSIPPQLQHHLSMYKLHSHGGI